MTNDEIIRMARGAGCNDEFVKLAPDWLERFANLVAAAERNKLAAWMIQFGFATGHGDTMDDLVDALGSEVVDRIKFEISRERDECARIVENYCGAWDDDGFALASAIRSRSKA